MMLEDYGSSESAILKTKLLLHMDGANGSTSFIDEAGHTVNRYSTATISTEQSVFGGASGKFVFSGGQSELNIPVTDDMLLKDRDFCIEGRVFISDRSKYPSFFNQYQPGGVANALLISLPAASDANAYFQYTLDGSTVLTKSWAWNPSLNTYYPIRFSRVGDFLRFFVNGTSLGSVPITGSIYTSALNYSIGNPYHYVGAVYGFAGYIDEFRLTVGDGRGIANYTPVTTPFILD